MASAISNALMRSRAIHNSAHARGLLLKQSGGVPIVDIGAPSGSFFGAYNSNAGDKRRYGLFRGWVHAAVNALATEGGGQPVCVGRLEKRGGKKKPSNRKDFRTLKMTAAARSKAASQELEILTDHPLLDSLQNPNSVQGSWQFVYSFFANLSLTGWAYIVGGETKDGTYEFFSLPSTWVQPDHSDGPYTKFRVVNPRKPETAYQSDPLDRSQVAFAYIPNPADPLGGLAPAQGQLHAIQIDDHIQTSQTVFFKNGIFPSVIVTVGADPHPDMAGGRRPRLTSHQRRQVYGAIKKVMGGVANYGNPAIVDGLIEKIERLSATQNEMGWDKSEKTIRTRILSAFGVHPYILGEPVSVGGYAQAAKIEERFCKRVNTYLNLLGGMMTSFCQRLTGDPSLLVWWEECRWADPSLEQSLWLAARRNNDVSQNEFRAWAGLPPDEDRNEGNIPVSSLSQVTAIASSVVEGKIAPTQGVAILEGMGLPSDLAKKVAGGPRSQPAAMDPNHVQSPQKPEGGTGKVNEDDVLGGAQEDVQKALALMQEDPVDLADWILTQWSESTGE